MTRSHDTIVITASTDSFPGLVEQLRALSVAVDARPLLRFGAVEDWTAVDAALDRLVTPAAASIRYAAVAFTSPRAVRAIAERLQHRGCQWPSAAVPNRPAVWGAGEGTARALSQYLGDVGEVHLPPADDAGRRGAAVALADAMISAGVSGPVLFPCGDRRRDELPDRLRSHGVRIDDVICYRALVATPTEARAAVAGARIVIVASPTVAALLAGVCPADTRPALLAVGPVTAAASEAAGWRPAAVASSPTSEAICAAARSLFV